ncbi:MAG: YqaJ viral recombinase family protein [Actinomycetales bacterium]|nr:YqaJ viral recombinase family protein [Actinomycetales bacterium]
MTSPLAPTVIQPALWDEPAPHHSLRVVADARDRVAWLRARAHGVTATDVARLSGPRAVPALAMEKLLGSRFSGNAATEHGRRREPAIAAWAGRVYGMTASSALFHAADRREHLATPDGLRERDGRVELCEIKTTASGWSRVPRAYLRQVWWQQYVLGAERSLLVWERHDGFVPVGEPECRWIDRDDREIARLVALADQLLVAMRRDPVGVVRG